MTLIESCKLAFLFHSSDQVRSDRVRFTDEEKSIVGNSVGDVTIATEHFLSSPNHTANDRYAINPPLEKIFFKRDSLHKARKTCLILKAGTLQPLRLA